MPIAPRRPCSAPLCRGFVPCPAHPPRPRVSGWAARPSATAAQRTRGTTWMTIRRRVMDEEHACYLCGADGRHDDVVDHVVGLAHGGDDDRRNLHRCCRRCHDRKTARERRR